VEDENQGEPAEPGSLGTTKENWSSQVHLEQPRRTGRAMFTWTTKENRLSQVHLEQPKRTGQARFTWTTKENRQCQVHLESQGEPIESIKNK